MVDNQILNNIGDNLSQSIPEEVILALIQLHQVW